MMDGRETDALLGRSYQKAPHKNENSLEDSPPAASKKPFVVALLGFLAVVAITVMMMGDQQSGLSSESASLWPYVGLPNSKHHAHHHDKIRMHHARHHGKIRMLLRQLNADMTGAVLTDHNPAFEEETNVWNQCPREAPLAVVQVADVDDVSKAMPVLVELYQKYGIPFRIKSGGHSYTGWSTVENGIILSLSRLNAISFQIPDAGLPPSPDGMVVGTLGPAARVLDALTEVVVPHDYGLVTGLCPGVAEGGFALGGGLGYLSRQYGLGADNIMGLEVVLGNGTIVTANDKEHPDLFWAMRGAGQNNFGVVTSIQYRFFPSQDEQLFVEGIVPLKYASEFLKALGDIEEEMPGKCFFFVEGNTPDGLPLAISWFGTSQQDLRDGQTYIAETLSQLLPEKVAQSFEYTKASWRDSAVAGGNLEGNLVQAWNGFLMREDNHQKAWDKLMPLIWEVLQVSEYVMIDLELWGGAIGAKDPSDTAFYWRDGLFNVGFLVLVPADLKHADHIFADVSHKINQIWDKMNKYLHGLYPNYPMSSLDDSSYYAEITWGGNLEKLSAVKDKYDPENNFNHPQNIPLPSKHKKYGH